LLRLGWQASDFGINDFSSENKYVVAYKFFYEWKPNLVFSNFMVSATYVPSLGLPEQYTT